MLNETLLQSPKKHTKVAILQMSPSEPFMHVTDCTSMCIWVFLRSISLHL
jgi:hypothetical protein